MQTEQQPQAFPERLKEKVASDQEAVAGMSVWRRRLDTDDGYEFRAAKVRPGKDWHAAPHQDLVTIACRALTGHF